MTMELEFERDTLVCYETVADMTLCQEETQESIVPDACPDIADIVDVWGQAFLTGKQVREGAALVTGTVRTWVLYRPEEGGGLRRMEVSLPFTCQAEAPGLTDRGKVLARPRLRSADARTLNPRKVLLRVDLAVDVTACQPEEQPICRGVLAPESKSICQRQFSGETYQVTSIQEKPFTFTEELRLPAGQGEAPQVLAALARPVCTDSKVIGSKLIFKGLVELQFLLQDAGGGLSAVHESLPFSQVMETEGDGEEGDGQTLVELTELRYEPDPGDGRSLEIELELLAQARVRRSRPVTLLQDLYSTAWQTEADRENRTLCSLEERSVRPQAARELLETGEMVRSVVDSRLSLGQVTQSREGDQLLLSAEVWLTALYLNEEETLRRVQHPATVTCRVDCPQDCRCGCDCFPSGEVFAVPMTEGIEVRFNLDFHCLITRRRAVAAVRGGRVGEARTAGAGPRPSMVLRLAAPGEGVWELAKAYGTTTQEILQANELEDEDLPEGRMLLIPSCRT